MTDATQGWIKLHIIDSHTAGEPTRTVISGFPSLGTGDVKQQQQYFAQEFDSWRQAIMLEPKGDDILVGALLCPSYHPEAQTGVIFFNNAGYLGMCGHGTIGIIKTLAYLGKIHTGTHHIETPVGLVTTELHTDGSVCVHNVPAYRYRHAVHLNVPGYGEVCGDIAWGGNWFFLVSATPHALTQSTITQLTDYCWAIRQSLEHAGIYGEEGHLIDHIELFCHHAENHGQNFVLCPGKAYDRSPCGTGTSAKLACLAADNLLAPGEIWYQKSIIGSEFQGSYQWAEEKILPTIRGHAYLCADSQLFIDPQDPFAWGIPQ